MKIIPGIFHIDWSKCASLFLVIIFKISNGYISITIYYYQSIYDIVIALAILCLPCVSVDVVTHEDMKGLSSLRLICQMEPLLCQVMREASTCCSKIREG